MIILKEIAPKPAIHKTLSLLFPFHSKQLMRDGKIVTSLMESI